jgi:hypothetical protein
VHVVSLNHHVIEVDMIVAGSASPRSSRGRTSKGATPPAGTAIQIERTAYIRHRELTRVQALRYGGTPDRYQLPIGATAQAFALCVAMRRAGRRGDTIGNILAERAPWLSDGQIVSMIASPIDIESAGRELGLMIGMTEAERRAAKAWRLQSIDGKAPRDKRQRDARDGRRARRAAKGATTRAEADTRKRVLSIGSERQTKPWVAMGLTRSTWQRRGKPMPAGPGNAGTR